MSSLLLLALLLILAEKVWKHVAVIRYFRRAVPKPPAAPQFVSILQPILSGDPTLGASLGHNLAFRSGYPREYIWLVDSDDLEAQRICRELIGSHPESQVHLVIAAPPGDRENPKMVKLIAGAKLARGQVIVVLDDDTRLPDGGLEQCLPFLELPGVGIAFGLPYYVSFDNAWSSLIAYFVNSNSLLTYIPYLQLAKPFTINGMFYALSRQVLEAIGGFDGLEAALADDFAMAQRVRAHGYELAQTPLRHAISTHVTGFRHYLGLMHRWMIFPRESLMRHLGWQDRLLVYSLNLVPAFFPPAVLLLLLTNPSAYLGAYSLLYFGYSYAVFAHLNARYLNGTSPWRSSWLVPLIQIVFPIQLLSALVSPQRIRWRGHLMQVEPGGGFRFIRRRPGQDDPGPSSAHAGSDGAVQWSSHPDERSSR